MLIQTAAELIGVSALEQGSTLFVFCCLLVLLTDIVNTPTQIVKIPRSFLSPHPPANQYMYINPYPYPAFAFLAVVVSHVYLVLVYICLITRVSSCFSNNVKKVELLFY